MGCEGRAERSPGSGAGAVASMDQAIMSEPQEGGFAITPEEDRFLRAYFHRHAGRYLLALGALALAIVCTVWITVRPDDDGAAALAGAEAEAESQSQEIEAVRAENQTLRAEVEELGGRLEALDAAARQVASVEKRLAGALRRLDRVESRVEQGSAASNAAPPDAAGAWDASSILERLYNLEVRQEREEQSRTTFEKSLLARMHELEQRESGVANATASTQQGLLERLDSLEQRAYRLEQHSGLEQQTGSAPAAPTP